MTRATPRVNRTFALLLGLWARFIAQQQRGGRQPTSTLILTPHRDLALQCAYWAYRLHGTHLSDTDPLVQVLLRSMSEPLTHPSRLAELRASKSPLTIGTPQAVLEVLKADPLALPLGRFGTVVVDEVDNMVEIPPPPGAGQGAKAKFEKNMKRHPTPTRQILDMVYRDEGSYAPLRRPQLVIMSATLSHHQRTWLQGENGWFEKNRNGVVSIYTPSMPSKMVAATPEAILHHAIVVSPTGMAANIEGAETPTPTAVEEKEDEIPLEQTSQSSAVVGPDLDDAEGFQDTPSPFNPYALEAIALAFALDVPRMALLVLPASAAVRRAVFDLRSLGVNAYGLDVLQTERGGAYLEKDSKAGSSSESGAANPILLVSTLASTRGLDLPEMTHVFLLGIPGDRSADTYAHMAGRVGRFGRAGKVISVVEAIPKGLPLEKAEVPGQSEARKDEVEWLKETFEQLGITPVVFEHFD